MAAAGAGASGAAEADVVRAAAPNAASRAAVITDVRKGRSSRAATRTVTSHEALSPIDGSEGGSTKCETVSLSENGNRFRFVERQLSVECRH